MQPVLAAHLRTLANERIVRIENRFAWAHTEAYAYLVHMLLFAEQLSKLNFFLQDDTCDEEYRLNCGKYCGSVGHTHDIVNKVVSPLK